MIDRDQLLREINTLMLDHILDDRCQTCLEAARKGFAESVTSGIRRDLSCPMGRKLIDQYAETR